MWSLEPSQPWEPLCEMTGSPAIALSLSNDILRQVTFWIIGNSLPGQRSLRIYVRECKAARAPGLSSRPYRMRDPTRMPFTAVEFNI
jgi:hypothetical protein